MKMIFNLCHRRHRERERERERERVIVCLSVCVTVGKRVGISMELFSKRSH